MRHECTLMPFGVAQNLYNAIKVCPEFSASLREAARSGLSRYGVSEGAYIYQDGFSITRESDSASRGTPKFRSPFLERAVNIHTGLGMHKTYLFPGLIIVRRKREKDGGKERERERGMRGGRESRSTSSYCLSLRMRGECTRGCNPICDVTLTAPR